MKLVVNKNDYTKGEIIKAIREWAGKTQKEFGQEIKRSEISIQKYEADVINYSMQTFLDIAKANNVTITLEKKK